MYDDDKGWNDEQILARAQSKSADAVGWYTSKLSKQRKDVLDYYNGKLPKRFHAGSSSYVEPVVYVKTRQMRDQLVETFSGTTHLCSFDSFNPAEQGQAQIQTDYCAHVLFKDNPGLRIIHDVIHDGLIARCGIARVFWDKNEVETEKEFTNVTEQELQAWQQNPAITEIEGEQHPDGTYSGRIVEKSDHGRIVVESVNPEEFFIEPQAKYLSNDGEFYCGTKTSKTLDWVKKNWPKETKGVQNSDFGDVIDLMNTPEVIARFQGTDLGVRYGQDDDQEEIRHVSVVELFMKFKRAGDLAASLHRVVFCGKVLLECKPVDRINLFCFTPLPEPHTFYGDSYAGRLMPLQDILTSSKRQVLDHAAITNNPRLLVRTGSLKNPRELLDNRLGGIVNVTSPDAVQPMQQAQLNPSIWTLIQNAEQQVDLVSGISALSVGQNPDAVSEQNSAGLVEKLMSASQVGQKQIARNFVNQFLIPVYEAISDLVVTHETQIRQIQVAGGYVQVDPAQWLEGRTATASAHLGFGEREQEAQKIWQIGQAMAKDPIGKQFMGPQGAYAMLADAMVLDGRKNSIQRWFPVTPDKLPPPQPDPLHMAEVQLKQAQAQAHMIEAQATAKKVDGHNENADLKLKLAQMQAYADHRLKEEGEHRRNIETMNRIDISQREMHLDEQAPPDTRRAIVSPNG